MPEPFPCPSCGKLLRLPEGAASGRCPHCKAISSVPGAAAPPTPFAAAPLPFGKPAPKARDVEPQAGPPSRRGPRIRAKVAAETDANDAPDDVERDRRRKIREEVEELERNRERADRQLAQLADDCRMGRRGVKFLTYSLGTYAFTTGLIALCLALVMFGSTVKIQDTPLTKIGITVAFGFGFISPIFAILGFLFVVLGPKVARHLGYFGIGLTLLHAVLALILSVRTLNNLKTIVDGDVQDFGAWASSLGYQECAALTTALPALADHPARFLNGYRHSWPILIIATVEFARLVVTYMVMQTYASEGKSSKLAHYCMRGLSKLFWLLLLTSSFRLATASGFDRAPQGETIYQIGLAAHAVLTTNVYVWMFIFQIMQLPLFEDVSTIVDHRRFADKRTKIDD